MTTTTQPQPESTDRQDEEALRALASNKNLIEQIEAARQAAPRLRKMELISTTQEAMVAHIQAKRNGTS